jgi:hypothetical protein
MGDTILMGGDAADLPPGPSFPKLMWAEDRSSILPPARADIDVIGGDRH